MKKVKLTKAQVDKLDLPEHGSRYEVFDTELTGYGIRVSPTGKTYFVLRRVGGKLTRVTLGKHGVLTADQARKEAVIALGQMTKGVDLNQEKAKARMRGVTLEEATELYLTERTLKPDTATFYRMMVNVHLKALKNTPLREITDDKVKAKHKSLTKENGKATANNVMKTLRAIYNFARAEAKGELPENPVNILSNKKTWNKVEPRKSCIKQHELHDWYQAVRQLTNTVIRDFLLFTVFNGLRKDEALSLQWRDIDFEGRTFTVRDTKNHHDHTLPFSTFTESLLKARYSHKENGYVFPGTGKTGHLQEPRKQLEAIERTTRKMKCGEGAITDVDAREGIRTTVHDLRRTFANTAEELVSYSVLKRLLNHTPKKDVTQDYLAISVEKLRAPIQDVADAMMFSMQAWSDYSHAEEASYNPGVINLAEKRRQRQNKTVVDTVDNATTQFQSL